MSAQEKKRKIECWECFQCNETECPAYELGELRCWLIAGTHCREEIQGKFIDKIDMCLECEVFRVNIDHDSILETLRLLSRQLSELRETVATRDREMEDLSLEMALGVSEVFDALRDISSGDPSIRLSEDSDIELISKLKQMVNRTAENLGEIVELSHEFAIGLAEHFDVMHRVSTGDLSARVTKTSQLEILIALAEVTNQMIESVQREIGERKRAEQAHRESEEKYRLLIDNLPNIVFKGYYDWSAEFVDDKVEQLTGYSMDEFYSGKVNWRDLICEEDIDYVERTFMDALKTTKSYVREYRINTKTGEVKWVQEGSQIVCDDDGRVEFVSGAFLDITDRKRAEEALKENEELLRATLESTADGILVVDAQGRVVNSNTRFAEMWNIPQEVIETRDDKALLDYVLNQVNDPEEFVSTVKERYKSQDAAFDTILFKDGRVFERHSYPLIRNQEVAGRVWSFRDVTETKRAEEEKRRLEAQLQRAQKMEAIGTLAGGVAHDLNNILSGLVSYPQLLLMDLPEDSPLRDPIITIQESGKKAAAIVQDMLTLARRGVAVKEVVNFNEIISDYLKSPEYDKLISFHKDVQFTARLESDLLNVLGSPIHLSKVLMNLVANAAEAMPAGGEVEISTKNRYVDKPLKGYDYVKEGDYVVLSVFDNGIGISEEDRKRIFEPFYTKKVMGRSGTGLGMAVVWTTVKDHNGYIDVESVEGEGTRVDLYFPVTRKESSKEERKIALQDYTGSERILVVDDVKEQRVIATNMLKKLGYEVESAASGEDALKYLENGSADLIILDMIMDPGIDGLETYRRTLELHPGQKAIIASGFSETARVKEAQKLGAGQYLKKPYTLEKLAVAVRKELDG